MLYQSAILRTSRRSRLSTIMLYCYWLDETTTLGGFDGERKVGYNRIFYLDRYVFMECPWSHIQRIPQSRKVRHPTNPTRLNGQCMDVFLVLSLQSQKEKVTKFYNSRIQNRRKKKVPFGFGIPLWCSVYERRRSISNNTILWLSMAWLSRLR